MPSDNNVILKKTLVDNGHNLTHARLAVFGLLNNNEPQTISQILVKANGLVDRVSVYRNIELFEKIGIVRRVYLGWKYKLELSDKFFAHHHHLTCLSCGKTVDIEDEKHIDSFIKEVAKKNGFVPRGHQFEIEGLCSKCQAKQ